MRSLISLIIAAACVVECAAQGSEKLRCQRVSLKPPAATDSIRLPFSQVRVRDERSDSSKFGFFRSSLDPELYKYCFETGSVTQLGRFMNGYLSKNVDSASGDQVLVCIRKLWITADDTTDTKSPSILMTKAFFKAEFYLNKNDHYYPLYRFDTVITEEGRPRFQSTKLIEQAITSSLQKLKRVNYTAVLQSRKISPAELEKYYAQLTDMPALTTGKIAKGVFNTFQEFKNNQPSDTAFEIRFEALADMLYVKDANGQFYLKRNVWGFSDGEKAYIRFGNNFFQLERRQHTWEFFGSDKLRVQTFGSNSRYYNTRLGPTTGPAMESIKLQRLQYHHLDMQTGEILY